MINYKFADPPRSTRRIRATQLTYVRPPTSSFDWAGADWRDPIGFDFEEEVMTARRYEARVALAGEEVFHPEDIIHQMFVLWEKSRRGITDSGYVVDADERLGIRFSYDFMRDMTTMSTESMCWPAVEGVTVPIKDVTR